MHLTEQALRALLRLLFGDMNLSLRLPSSQEAELHVEGKEMYPFVVHAFSDASHGPYCFNQRKGITGGAVFCENGLVRMKYSKATTKHFTLIL